MEILWKTLTWTLSLVVMAASEFQSINRLSHNSQGMTGGREDLKGTVHLEINVDVKSGVELHRLTILKHSPTRVAGDFL